mmetsp:Transcript_4636/g.14027  ORF Transcript_4636/g.14027 Transcript_4636/m.14027 type:complete len:400 (-) Transcript_4636:611-1810(-)
MHRAADGPEGHPPLPLWRGRQCSRCEHACQKRLVWRSCGCAGWPLDHRSALPRGGGALGPQREVCTQCARGRRAAVEVLEAGGQGGVGRQPTSSDPRSVGLSLLAAGAALGGQRSRWHGAPVPAAAVADDHVQRGREPVEGKPRHANDRSEARHPHRHRREGARGFQEVRRGQNGFAGLPGLRRPPARARRPAAGGPVVEERRGKDAREPGAGPVADRRRRRQRADRDGGIPRVVPLRLPRQRPGAGVEPALGQGRRFGRRAVLRRARQPAPPHHGQRQRAAQRAAASGLTHAPVRSARPRRPEARRPTTPTPQTTMPAPMPAPMPAHAAAKPGNPSAPALHAAVAPAVAAERASSCRCCSSSKASANPEVSGEAFKPEPPRLPTVRSIFSGEHGTLIE